MSETPNIKSPFKFLDPYEKEDHHLFFGRERETEQLYEQIQSAKLLLVYGASGTGKTSIINCGLTNKFGDTDWNPLFIRRGQNLTAATLQQIHGQLRDKNKSLPAGSSLTVGVEQLFWTRYIPVYLIFDQFEELFIQGDPITEQKPFFDEMYRLLNAETFCRVILVMREEYLAWLSDFEAVIPDLFDNRLRIEKMSERQLRHVIKGTLAAKEFDIELQEADATASQIIDNIRNERREVDLTELQVYLDHLYRQASINKGRRVFNPRLAREAGEMKNVLTLFLEEQLDILEDKLKTEFHLTDPQGIPLEILFTLVTNERTKRAMRKEDILRRLAQLPAERRFPPKVLDYCLEEFNRLRLINQLD
ncbi:MAG: ATP-binding protein [Lewinellaceae bacterium]|nr:ATP-binding protein [Phaeodactylibacter sp.]MCB9039299.1 ATP-binding protein [Lewinellaceae bacterium]